ncbi:MAG: hypothetical protein OXG69_11615 [bacterium]|nr:hypothetical protein [bacterium]
MEDVVRRMLPNNSKMSVASYVSQLWALRSEVRAGDLVVLPLKGTRLIALGVVTRGYWHRDDPEPDRRHVISVDWRRTDVPWMAANEDLRRSLSSPRTICSIKCADGTQRLHHLMTESRDPGIREHAAGPTTCSRLRLRELHAAFVTALGARVVWHSDPEVKPFELDLLSPLPSHARVYMYNATRPPGGRPAGEYKIQLIVPDQSPGERGSFDNSDDRHVFLVGYAVGEGVFVLWDAGIYREFSYSRNVQVKSNTILAAFAGEIGLQERMLRSRRGVTVREMVVAANADRLDEAIEMRLDLTLKRLLDEPD